MKVRVNSMKTQAARIIYVAATIAAFTGALLNTSDAVSGCCSDNPPIRSLDKTCLPAGSKKAEPPLFQGDLAVKYQEVAIVDSYIAVDKYSNTVQKQLRDLQAKGEAIGADALIRVRPLNRKVYGWQENPATPFWSVKQGESNDHFFRATAIKYLEQIHGHPTSIPLKTAGGGAVKQNQTPVLDTNRLLKVHAEKQRPQNVSVPEVYTTQQSPGIAK
jgi:hypothetical protein